MSNFVDDLVMGLSLEQRTVPAKWLYDAKGSQLFEQICEVPEYYPTRTECRLLERHAGDIARRIGPEAEIVEFGAGSTRKVRTLLGALERPTRYMAIDISGDFLEMSAQSLGSEFAGLSITTVRADFTEELSLPARAGAGRRMGFFPGSSIGNFEPHQATDLLRRMRQVLRGGALLIGVDLVKEPEVLHAAYNDTRGATAAFNLNLLVRANREARADFNLDNWLHCAFYNPSLRRVEMHLVSRRPQRVSAAGVGFDFEEGESIHTENSYKYTVESFQEMARAAGWHPRGAWTDGQRRFSLHWLWC